MNVVTALAALALVACSGDTPHGPATGPTSSSSSAGGLGGTGGGGAGGAGGTAAGSGGVSSDPCGNLCTKFQALGCDLSACKSRCPGWIEHAGDCGPQMAAEIDCIADSTTECGQDVCHAEFAALDACAQGVDCFAESCKGNSASGVFSCECSTGCSTGRIHDTCVQGPQDSMVTCQCFVGDRNVGSCNQVDQFCEVDFNCCKKYF